MCRFKIHFPEGGPQLLETGEIYLEQAFAIGSTKLGNKGRQAEISMLSI